MDDTPGRFDQVELAEEIALYGFQVVGEQGDGGEAAPFFQHIGVVQEAFGGTRVPSAEVLRVVIGG
jgi:hypothetical protein